MEIAYSSINDFQTLKEDAQEMIRVFITLLALQFSAAAYASDEQPLFEIRQAVEAFLMDETLTLPQGERQVVVGKLDSRLRLARCPTPLDIFLPSAQRLQSRVTVGVRCHIEKPWVIYVPARIQVLKSILVANRTLNKGDFISSSDLVFQQADVMRYKQGYFESLDDVTNKVAKRTISVGKPITANAVEEPKLVKRGQRVRILAKRGSLQVQIPGTALSDGKKHEVIRVRNDDSKRTVNATVMDEGIVEVPM